MLSYQPICEELLILRFCLSKNSKNNDYQWQNKKIMIMDIVMFLHCRICPYDVFWWLMFEVVAAGGVPSLQ